MNTDQKMPETPTPVEFALWLNGYLEGTGPELTAEQTAKIKEKLDLIVAKIVADKLMQHAENKVRQEEERKKREADLTAHQLEVHALIEQMKARQAAEYTSTQYFGVSVSPLTNNGKIFNGHLSTTI